MEPRLAAGVEVGAILRRADSLGGFGAVLQKGDSERGSILLSIVERGTAVTFLERMLQPNGIYKWQVSGPVGADSLALSQYIARRQRADPDCWILELDIPSAERFIAEMTSEG